MDIDRCLKISKDENLLKKIEGYSRLKHVMAFIEKNQWYMFVDKLEQMLLSTGLLIGRKQGNKCYF